MYFIIIKFIKFIKVFIYFNNKQNEMLFLIIIIIINYLQDYFLLLIVSFSHQGIWGKCYSSFPTPIIIDKYMNIKDSNDNLNLNRLKLIRILVNKLK